MTLEEHILSLPVPPVLDVLGKFVHLRNARVGTTSMDEGPLRGRCVMQRRDKHLWKTVWENIIFTSGTLQAGLVFFTFVRNPWDRICSAFYQCRDRARTDENKIDRHWHFKDWVKNILAADWPQVNRHFAEQYPTAYFEGQAFGFVGRFEDIQVDWVRLSPLIGVPSRLPHWNSGAQGDYVDHYDDDTRQIIGEMYKREIEAFGYEFGK